MRANTRRRSGELSNTLRDCEAVSGEIDRLCEDDQEGRLQV
jgi:hypothetical protein